jgi:hypothetical protein
MKSGEAIQVGMEVINVDGLLLGHVEQVGDSEFLVQGAHFTFGAVESVDGQRLHLRDLRETELVPGETDQL